MSSWSLFLPVFCSVFFPSHWLLSHYTPITRQTARLTGRLICLLGLLGAVMVNPVPYNEILDLSILKAIADDNFNAAQMKQFFLDGVENIVGKAVIVRYLTGRYLTEYAHAPEMIYERNVVIEGRTVPVKVIDVSGKNIEQKAGNKDLLNKVDGIVIIYSVTDHHSFDFAEGICEWLRREKKNTIPVVLLGNKADLCHIRCVKNHKPDVLEWRHDSYMVTECSASTDATDIVRVFNMLINKVLEKSDTPTKQQKKISQNPLGSPKIIRASLRRRFSVFTRERPSTM